MTTRLQCIILAVSVLIATAMAASARTAAGAAWGGASADNAAQVEASGGYHTCLVVRDGRVRCWGRNDFGQLGDGTTITRSRAAEVSGLGDGVASISTGGYHTCALSKTGGVKCWGENAFGQLGDGTTIDRLVPVDVSGLASNVVAVAAGRYHSCAVTSDGGVKCWGLHHGQAGDGTANFLSTLPPAILPIDVTGLPAVASIAAGGSHTCAVTVAGGLKCWGDNGSGQLGDGTGASGLVPVDVSGLTSGVSSVAAGPSHTCAVTTDGGVKCWGYAEWTGLNATIVRTPTAVAGVEGVVALVAGGSYNCAIGPGGLVKCWGGDRTTSGATPADPGLPMVPFVALAAGDLHNCAVAIDGRAFCWGNNDYGQLGAGTSRRAIAAPVAGLSAVTAIAAHGGQVCAIGGGGQVKCWGSGVGNELGDRTTPDRTTPETIPGLTGVASVAQGGLHTCVLTSGGGVKCWGSNRYGQLGDGTTTDRVTPVDVSGLTSGMKAVTAGDALLSCAVTASGTVKCWGSLSIDIDYRIRPRPVLTPADVPGLTGVTAIAAGTEHACALTAIGGVKCWGVNFFTEIGVRGWPHETPVDVPGLSTGVVAIAAGHTYTCALLAAGGVKCWGSTFNRAAHGGGLAIVEPADVAGVTDATAIAVGSNHACAVTNGAVRCWGANTYGQLGDGTNTDTIGGVTVKGLAAPVVALAAASNTTCALTTTGTVSCWGANYGGQLGDGSVADGTRPVVVSGLDSFVAHSDFNGDGRDDIVRRDALTGDIVFWLMNGTAVGSEVRVPEPADRNWQIEAVADFDLDGKADLLWHNDATGEVVIWDMNGTRHMNTVPLDRLSDVNWQVAAAADINGDGWPDVIWRHATTGEVMVWYLGGAGLKTTHVGTLHLTSMPDSAWTIGGAADYNGDGFADLLLNDTATGQHVIRLMSFAADDASVPLDTSPASQIVAAGDFNGDGHGDVVWRNSTNGETSIWLMVGTKPIATAALPRVSGLTSRRPRGNSDNGGRAVWRTGQPLSSPSPASGAGRRK